MSDMLQLKMEYRPESGKGANKRLRNTGKVPGIFYSFDGENMPVKVDFVPLSKMYNNVGLSKVVELQIEKDGQSLSRKALIRGVHQHPVKAVYNHVDFFGVNMDKEIVVSIPVKVQGRAKGVVIGGKLEFYRESIEVKCLPGIIPDDVVLDVTELDGTNNIHIEGIELPEGVKAVYDQNFAVVGIKMPKASAKSEEESE